MSAVYSGIIGLVAIGRNEGERLRACLASVRGRVAYVVYVDSGSTDASVAMAEGLGVHVVNLDMTQPFTAARARNEGFAALSQLMPAVQYVQFVDGDCQVVEGWIEAAAEFLNAHSEYAAVCGRRRERFPERSIYNKLCDIEWDTPIGDAKYCGGDVLLRVSAFVQANGYRASLIAGEEPELCVRLRHAGWQIYRIGLEMTLHDAAMTRFGQWWKRSTRAGYAYAEGAHLHGAPPELHWVKEARRALIWGGVLPLAICFLAFVFGSVWLGLLLLYPLQVLRLARTMGGLRAFFLVSGKFAEAWGAIKFGLASWSGAKSKIIEYK